MQLTMCVTEEAATGSQRDTASFLCFTHGGWLCVDCQREHVEQAFQFCAECSAYLRDYAHRCANAR